MRLVNNACQSRYYVNLTCVVKYVCRLLIDCLFNLIAYSKHELRYLLSIESGAVSV